jgi:thiamine biosynthesis lipoprotein
LFIILGQLVILTGCPSNLNPDEDKEIKVWQYSSFAFFDTVSYIYSYKGDEQVDFQKNCEPVEKLLKEYHQLFDIYNEYSGVVNLNTINNNAGKDALVVEQKLIDFLLYAKEIYTLTNGETNVMLGPVLKLWHDARETASNGGQKYVPSMEDLTNANQYVDINLLEIDDEKNNVRGEEIKISTENSKVNVYIIPTNEELAIARDTLAITSK